jgi:hypothetical protein
LRKMRSLLAKRQKVPLSGNKLPRTEKPFSEITKRPDTKAISIYIEKVRAKLHQLRE